MFVADVFSEWELDPSALVRNQSGNPPEQGMPWLGAWLAPQGGCVEYTLKCVCVWESWIPNA